MNDAKSSHSLMATKNPMIIQMQYRKFVFVDVSGFYSRTGRNTHTHTHSLTHIKHFWSFFFSSRESLILFRIDVVNLFLTTERVESDDTAAKVNWCKCLLCCWPAACLTQFSNRNSASGKSAPIKIDLFFFALLTAKASDPLYHYMSSESVYGARQYSGEWCVQCHSCCISMWVGGWACVSARFEWVLRPTSHCHYRETRSFGLCCCYCYLDPSPNHLPIHLVIFYTGLLALILVLATPQKHLSTTSTMTTRTTTTTSSSTLQSTFFSTYMGYIDTHNIRREGKQTYALSHVSGSHADRGECVVVLVYGIVLDGWQDGWMDVFSTRHKQNHNHSVFVTHSVSESVTRCTI